LLVGFIDDLQNVTTNNYSAIANSHTLQFTTAHIKTFQSPMSSLVVAWYRLSTADAPLILGSRTIPMPQLPASNSNSSQRLNRSSPLTDSLINQLTPRHSAQLYCLLITRHGPHREHRSISYSIVTSRSCRTGLVENTASQLVHWCVLGICCRATAVVYRVIT
jgi:hypothetical protein